MRQDTGRTRCRMVWCDVENKWKKEQIARPDDWLLVRPRFVTVIIQYLAVFSKPLRAENRGACVPR